MDFSPFVPIIWRHRVHWIMFAFYVVIEVVSRIVARRLFPTDSKLDVKRRDVIGRYPPSWVHAVICSLLALAPPAVDVVSAARLVSPAAAAASCRKDAWPHWRVAPWPHLAFA